VAYLPFSVLYTQTTASQQVGVTGLTPTVNVYRVTLSDNTVTQVVTNGVTFEIGNGLYGYTYSATLDFTFYWYIARFTTTNTAVQAKDIASAWFDYPSSLTKDAASTIRSGGIAAASFAAGAIDAAAIANGTIDAATFAAGAIDAAIKADTAAYQAWRDANGKPAI